MAGTQFKVDVMVLPIGGYDLILGVNWMKVVSPVIYDFGNNSVSVYWKGSRVELRSNDQPTKVKVLHEVKHNSWMNKGDTYFLIQLMEITEDKVQDSPPAEIMKLLGKYEDVYAEPKGLPPVRKQDHKIPLKADSSPVNASPYKCHYAHKKEIEVIVKKMLESGIIRHSCSPYASPVLLIKKKDQSWKLCVDYRALNALKVKNKFPIPIIEELLAELKGSTVFSKLDLGSGYHQIRVHPEDIEKTAFRTRIGHYEFMVMPFGLTNAPATFQGLMNEVFSNQLRDYVLVFF